MAAPDIIVGIIGSILLIIAWVWETWENYEQHKISVHMHFSLLYITGNLLLTIYSWWIHSTIFFVLSIILIIAILFETIYAIATGRKNKHRKLRRNLRASKNARFLTHVKRKK
jgi:uncharacterized membrane protein